MSPEPLPERLSYRTLQWLVAACALLHNLEEAVTMSRFAPQIRERLSGVAPASLLAVTGNLSWFYTALVVATLVPCIVVLNAVMRRTSRAAAWAVVFVQSLFFVNVFLPHVPAALLMGGYAPGVVTAVAIQLPWSVIFLRRSVREGRVSKSGVALAVGLAVPALVVLLGALYLVAGKFTP
jgi:hypothetical protein